MTVTGGPCSIEAPGSVAAVVAAGIAGTNTSTGTITGSGGVMVQDSITGSGGVMVQDYWNGPPMSYSAALVPPLLPLHHQQPMVAPSAPPATPPEVGYSHTHTAWE